MTQNRSRQKKRGLAVAACCMVLGACAAGEPLEQRAANDSERIAETLGCAADEVAVCVDTNCDPDDYQCASREDARKLFKAGEFRHQ